MILNLFKGLLLICVLSVGGQILAQTVKENKEEFSNLNFEKAYKMLTEKPDWLFSEDICPFDVFPKKVDEREFIPDSCDKDATVCLEDCKKNDGRACYTLAVMIQRKKTPFQDYSESLFLRSCKLGVVSGCTNRAARILDAKPEDAKSLTCAVNTFEKTCEKDDPWGCTMFGFALHRGISRQKDDEKALQALSKSCKYGDLDQACVMAKELIEVIKKSKAEKTKQ